ncbi:MAG: elongation factor G [Actinobacteria bacterium]|nr:elongation factor G [Actinomycetota bacterium]
MNGYQPANIRNVALVGHNGSGKTTLAESLLFIAGAIQKQGSTDAGNSVCDFEPEESKHHMSISLALAPFASGAVKVNLIDCPGYTDFFGEVKTALVAADLAIVVVSGVEGIEPQAEAVWEYLDAIHMPRMIFINKLDRERASFDRTLSAVKSSFGPEVLPVQLPVGVESDFHGIVDLAANVCTLYDQGTATSSGIPDSMISEVEAAREQFIEGTIVADDGLMESYLEGSVPDVGQLTGVLSRATSECSAYPVLCGSASTLTGIDQVTQAIVSLGPAADARPGPLARAGNTEVRVPCDPAGKQVARVFKTFTDPYVGRISILKALSGTFRPDSVLVNSRSHVEERLHVIETLRGKASEPLSEAQAGDIFAVPKLSDTATGDTLSSKGFPVDVEHIPGELANYAVAIEPRTKEDEDKLMTALHRLQEEDPALRVERMDETHQTLLWGTGDTHINVSLERLYRKYGVKVGTTDIVIPYRETITKPSQGEGKYKKQTGGHGQYGVADIRIEPLDRGSGYVFSDEVVGGAIPKQYIPAVEKGIEESMAQGGVHGFPVVDVHVSCYDGKYHPVDSSELSFKMAGALAFREALSSAGAVILEPISRIEVSVPDSLQGEILGDLSARRAHVQRTEAGSFDGTSKGATTITALVPRSEILRYALDLRSMTGGRGRFRAEHDHYDVLPANLVDKVKSDTTKHG